MFDALPTHLLGPAAGALIATICALASLMTLFRAHRTQAWLFTTGKILRSRVASRSDSETTYTQAAVAYRYAVDGTEYESDQVAIPNPRYITAAGARHMTARFLTNEPVTVYYDPAKPSRSVLITGASWRAYFDVLVTLAIAFVFLRFLLSAYRGE